MVALFEIFFVLAVLISLFISAEDIRHGKIANKFLLALLILGIAYQALSAQSILSVAYASLYALTIAFALWFLGLWPAGDAKLFAVLFLFFPQNLYGSHTLVFDFMVNTFVPIFFFMFFVIIARSKLAIIKDALKFTFEPYRVTMLAMVLLGFVWFLAKLIQLLTAGLAVATDYFVSLVLLFAIYEIFRRVLSAKMELLFFGLAVLRIVLDYRTIYSLAFAQYFATIMLVFLFFRFFILYLAFRLYTESVPIKKLRPGMSPAEMIIQKGDNFERVSFLNASLVSFMVQRKENIIHNIDFLSEDDVKRIKELRAKAKIPFDDMLINKVQPFAVFILLGYMLTVLCKGNFIFFLASMLKQVL